MVQFGAISGWYTMSQAKAREALRQAAEAVTREKGVSRDIQLVDKGDKISILGRDYVDSQQGTKLNPQSKTFTAEAQTRSTQDEREAENLLKLLLGNMDGFRLNK